MHPPVFVRELSAAERARLEAALRAADAFTVRRAQIVPSSAEGRRPRAIARDLRCAAQTVRNGIRAFNAAGLAAALTAGSSRPRSAAAPVPGAAERERLRAILHQPPRAFGHARSTWTLDLLARAAHEQGLSPTVLAGGDDPASVAAAGRGLEAGQALGRPAPIRPTRKKRRRDRLLRLARGRPGWAFGFADEVWFSRLARPASHAWAAPGERLRLAMHATDRDDPEPKALACHGLWLPERERMLLRFVAGRPVSTVTRAFLAWVAERLTAEGMRVLALVWDNAAWHVSREVRVWIRGHNRRVKAAGAGCRLLVCRLPSKSPHGRLLTAAAAQMDRAPAALDG
jgi:transposase